LIRLLEKPGIYGTERKKGGFTAQKGDPIIVAERVTRSICLSNFSKENGEDQTPML
jgi:hypothetical protein